MWALNVRGGDRENLTFGHLNISFKIILKQNTNHGITRHIIESTVEFSMSYLESLAESSLSLFF